MNPALRLVSIGAATAVWIFILAPYLISPFAYFHSHWIHFTGFGRALLKVFVVCAGISVVSSVGLAFRRQYLLAAFVAVSAGVAFLNYPKIKKFREVNMRPNNAMERSQILVTDRANARSAPSIRLAHLGR